MSNIFEQDSSRVPGDAILITTNLTKKYGNTVAVDHVSLTVSRGDIYGLIGGSESGKTTFMRIICGLVKPAEGELELFNISYRKSLQNARKKIGALIGQPAVYPNMSALENLEVQQRYLGLKDKGASADALRELLKLVGLGDAADKKAGTFSVEMKQRLGIAIALTGSPELLILDEPAARLGPADTAKLQSLLTKLNQETGLTILFSGRDLSEMEHLATRYGFLEKGRLVREITAKELE